MTPAQAYKYKPLIDRILKERKNMIFSAEKLNITPKTLHNRLNTCLRYLTTDITLTKEQRMEYLQLRAVVKFKIDELNGIVQVQLAMSIEDLLDDMDGTETVEIGQSHLQEGTGKTDWQRLVLGFPKNSKPFLDINGLALTEAEIKWAETKLEESGCAFEITKDRIRGAKS